MAFCLIRLAREANLRVLWDSSRCLMTGDILQIRTIWARPLRLGCRSLVSFESRYCYVVLYLQ